MLSKLGLICVLVAWAVPSHTLECGVLMNDTRDVSQVITTCLIPTIPVVVTEKIENVTVSVNTTNEDDPEEPQTYGESSIEADEGPSMIVDTDTFYFFPYFDPPPDEGPRRGLRIRRDTQNKTVSTTVAPPKPDTFAARRNSDNESDDPARCVVQCIMAAFNMIGSKGYPELNKVAASLIKDITNREMKDFLQDSVDECFQQLSDSVDLDPCTYSARLGTCLADKARFNCAEWPVGELPFPHKF